MNFPFELAALFFASFFWANKRKRENGSRKKKARRGSRQRKERQASGQMKEEPMKAKKRKRYSNQNYRMVSLFFNFNT